MKPLIGITCDIDNEGYRLKKNYVSAIANAGGIPLVIPPLPPVHSPGKGHPPKSPLDKGGLRGVNRIADLIDGLLLSGGGDIQPEYYGEDAVVPRECLKFAAKERIDFELSLLRAVIERGKPVLGICLGMQLINVALGGSLYQDIKIQLPDAFEHKSGRHEVRLSENFNSRFKIQDLKYSVNSSHHQAVKVPGSGLEVFAASGDGAIEGFYKKDYPFLLGLQWHPERDCDKLSLKLFGIFIEKAKEKR